MLLIAGRVGALILKSASQAPYFDKQFYLSMRDRRLTFFNGRKIAYDLPLDKLIEQALGPASEIRWSAFPAIAYNSSPIALDFLRSSLIHQDWSVRNAACASIPLVERPFDFSGELKTRLSDIQPAVVRTACGAIGKIGDRSANEDVAALLRSSDENTRSEAVQCLEWIWKSENFEPVFNLFKSDRHKAVRMRAGFTLIRNADITTWRPLFDVWVGETMPRYRKWACDLAHRFGEPEIMATLIKLAQDKDGHVRSAAASAMKTIGAIPKGK